jgi:hypothetical protein
MGELEERLTPRVVGEWWAKQRGPTKQDFGATRVAVPAWRLRMAQELANTINARIPTHWPCGDRLKANALVALARRLLTRMETVRILAAPTAAAAISEYSSAAGRPTTLVRLTVRLVEEVAV